MKKVILMTVACIMFWVFSCLTAQATNNQAGTITSKDSIQPKQGWMCSKALQFFHVAYSSSSRLKLGNGWVLTIYEDKQEAMANSASDNYSTVCVYLRSNNTFINMFTY